MNNSYSCGLERIKFYQPNGHPHETRAGGLCPQALQKQYQQLLCLLGSTKKLALNELTDLYIKDSMRAPGTAASKQNYANTLLPILGYLKAAIPSTVTKHIEEVIHKYPKSFLRITTPKRSLKYYLDQNGSDRIKNLSYVGSYSEALNTNRKYYQ